MIVGLILLVFALLGTPLFAIIGAGALIGFAQAGYDLQVVTIEIYRLAETPVLVAIPLFTFAGYLLGEGGAPQRLVRLTQAWLGWMPGGLPIVSLAACAFFTAFTGASGITIVALGALLLPALLGAGYPEKFSLGMITTSGSLGLLFAPSLPLILYGVVAQQAAVGGTVAIDDLFIAGILPGLLMLLVLSGYAIYRSVGLSGVRQPFAWTEAWAATREAAFELPLPVVVLGGIYSGWLAVSEAAAVTAAYVLLVEFVIHRDIPLRELPRVVRESMMLVGAILVILGVSLASTNYAIDAGLPEQLLNWTRTWVESKATFIAVLIVMLLLLGMLLDIFSAIVIVVPIILPMAASYGMNPLHLGILFLAAMQLGYFTPPVGMNLFIAAYRFDRSIIDLVVATVPYFLLLLGCVLLIGYWEWLSLAFLG
ncbi:MAG: TRAP transporter large permease subunit [Xanthomonadales bacterium]|nr:TRAP transporter large permease subunit [Xanthomonadales bacterium]